MKEAILILAWAIIWFLWQGAYYYFIEKWKLKTERDFSFKKEEHFMLKGKFEEISIKAREIDEYLINKNIPSKVFSEIFPKIAEVESLVEVYFPWIQQDYYVPYMNTISQYTDNNSNFTLKKEIGNKKKLLIESIRDIIKENEKTFIK